LASAHVQSRRNRGHCQQHHQPPTTSPPPRLLFWRGAGAVECVWLECPALRLSLRHALAWMFRDCHGWCDTGLKGILIGDPESVERNMMQMVNDLVGQPTHATTTATMRVCFLCTCACVFAGLRGCVISWLCDIVVAWSLGCMVAWSRGLRGLRFFWTPHCRWKPGGERPSSASSPRRTYITCTHRRPMWNPRPARHQLPLCAMFGRAMFGRVLVAGQLHAVNKRMQKGGWCRLCAAYSCCWCKWLLCPVWITAASTPLHPRATQHIARDLAGTANI